MNSRKQALLNAARMAKLHPRAASVIGSYINNQLTAVATALDLEGVGKMDEADGAHTLLVELADVLLVRPATKRYEKRGIDQSLIRSEP